MTQSNKKPLKTIKKEPLKNERPKSAKQQKSKPQQYIDGHAYLDKKHKKIHKLLEGTEFELVKQENDKPIDMYENDKSFTSAALNGVIKNLKVEDKNKEQYNVIEKKGNNTTNYPVLNDNKGGFNVFHQVNNKVGVKLNRGKYENSEFNNIFVSSLLEICGEKTIDTGKNNKNLYCDVAQCSLDVKMNAVKKKQQLIIVQNEQITYVCPYIPDNSYNKNDLIVFFNFLLYEMIKTNTLDPNKNKLLCTKDIKQLFKNETLPPESVSLATRLLCKIFLFQMFDRKPDNVVVMEDKDGKMDFREIDFDDNCNFDKGTGTTSVIFCNFTKNNNETPDRCTFTKNNNKTPDHCNFTKNNNKTSDQDLKTDWRNYLQFLIDTYAKPIILQKENIKNSFQNMLTNYIMTPKKIEELIRKTALKAKYMGLTEKQVINGIKDKMELWKEMLNDEKNGEVVNRIDGIEEARKRTLEALNEITEEQVEGIVHKIMMMHDLAYDKPDERKIKDDMVLNKSKENSAILKNEEIEAEIANIRKNNIKKFKEEQAQHINKFVKDNREITEEDITADNLISYFKLENDRSRSFFWVFGQRNKRFNALCETLEKLWKENYNNDIRIDENFLRNGNIERDERLIKALFNDNQQQGNNANQPVIHNRNNLQNTRTIPQQIADRLNQVGCCSCG